MKMLQEMMLDEGRFLCGVELVTTRGTMAEARAVRSREMASALLGCDWVDWISITDNAGGNPNLSPMSLGKPILYGGKEVMIHLSCKDFNRNGLESQAWQLASEGFHNILCLSGDYPVSGFQGDAKPVFDIDSVGLLTMLREMNRGLDVRRSPKPRSLQATSFFAGAVATNFKLHENEVLPQLLKLEKKLAVGARFIIAQVGYDTRKSHELLAYLQANGHGRVPLIGNVFLLNGRVASLFRTGKIPGVVISDALADECARQSASPDQGEAFFIELAAKQVAIFRGLGFRGAYIGGVEKARQVEKILATANAFGGDDWKQFAREISYGRPGEFYLYESDGESGLADPSRVSRAYEESKHRRSEASITTGYRISKALHEHVFAAGSGMFRLGEKIYRSSRDSKQGPWPLRVLERVSKSALYGCKDCGDCSLPEIAFSCPESACAKNQRNGPCGGTRDGQCEVHDVPCIWSVAYDRLKHEGRERELLAHSPVLQDQSLRGTSAWANMFLGRDHHSVKVRSQETPIAINVATKEEKACPKEVLKSSAS